MELTECQKRMAKAFGFLVFMLPIVVFASYGYHFSLGKGGESDIGCISSYDEFIPCKAYGSDPDDFYCKYYG